MLDNQTSTNLARALAAWGPDAPKWVRDFAAACDATSQKAAAARIGKSGGWASRIINRNYPAAYAEAKELISAEWGNDEVDCPLFGPMPERSCILNRRRKGSPQNYMARQFARACPTCPKNPDDANGRARATEVEPC